METTNAFTGTAETNGETHRQGDRVAYPDRTGGAGLFQNKFTGVNMELTIDEIRFEIENTQLFMRRNGMELSSGAAFILLRDRLEKLAENKIEEMAEGLAGV